MTLLALIPARGGSKGIPRKNIRLFCGKPLLQWSIDAALASACVDQVVVSTDDSEIADLAKAGGAEVPFLRPAELATERLLGSPAAACSGAAAQSEQFAAEPTYLPPLPRKLSLNQRSSFSRIMFFWEP